MKYHKELIRTDVEWLPEIPNHWQLKRLKDDCLVETGSRNTEDKQNEGEYPFFVRSQTMEFIDTYSFDGEAILTAGDGVGVAKVFHHYIGKFETHQRVYRISKFKNIYGRFLFYYLQENLYKEVLKFNAKSTVDSLRMPMFQRFPVLVPPLHEQTAIAQYLDTKTQAIDKKVNLLEKKIGYYKELRKSIINETVTKGLDKTVKLKDSGIKWIGQIPEHWEVKRLKEIGNIETSSVNKKIEEDEEMVKLVNYIDVYNNPNKEIWNKDDYMQVSAKINQIQNKILRQGDVLFTPSSETIEDIGVSSVVMENLKNTLYSYHLLRLKFREKIYLNFKKYMLNNDFVQYYFSHSATGTTRKILGLNTFYNLKVVFPPSIVEQTEIATYLDHKSQTIDKIVGNIQNQITTLKELRKTLIN